MAGHPRSKEVRVRDTTKRLKRLGELEDLVLLGDTRSQGELALLFGVSQPMIHKDLREIHEKWRAYRDDPRSLKKGKALTRLERMLKRLWERAEQPKLAVNKFGETIELSPDPRWYKLVLDTLEMINKLQGLYVERKRVDKSETKTVTTVTVNGNRLLQADPEKLLAAKAAVERLLESAPTLEAKFEEPKEN